MSRSSEGLLSLDGRLGASFWACLLDEATGDRGKFFNLIQGIVYGVWSQEALECWPRIMSGCSSRAAGHRRIRGDCYNTVADESRILRSNGETLGDVIGLLW